MKKLVLAALVLSAIVVGCDKKADAKKDAAGTNTPAKAEAPAKTPAK